MKICIPTYNRFKINTLKILEEFDPKDIYIFINNYDPSEWDSVLLKYHKENGSSYNYQLIDTRGIPAARNFILNFFDEGEKIVMLDDDIDQILGLDFNNLKKQLRPIESVKGFFEEAFSICEKYGAKLWGIYPVANAFYMSPKMNNKGFIIGTMFGVINNELRFDENLKLKEDYDFTLQNIIKYKKVARFDWITIWADHYKRSGGCVEQRSADNNLEKDCCDYILNKYPKYLRRNTKRENEVLISI